MFKKLTQKQEGTLFLFGVTSFIWFFIILNNNSGENLLFGAIICGIIFGAITTLVLAIFYVLMKSIFNW